MILHERDLFDLSTADPTFHDLTVPGSSYLPLMLAIRREDRRAAGLGRREIQDGLVVKPKPERS
jgi:hypothetical protein